MSGYLHSGILHKFNIVDKYKGGNEESILILTNSVGLLVTT